MNIIDAVKSGRKFKRKNWNKYWYVGCVIDSTDILATDWEIEERKIEITESEFDAIYHEVLSLNGRHEFSYELKKRLFEK